MTATFRITAQLHDLILADLRRPHPWAGERAGFIAAQPAETRDGLLVVASGYLPLADQCYVQDTPHGCEFNSDAMRHALQFALDLHASIFHVHLHDHSGAPTFSRTDLRESQRFVPDFWNVQPGRPHGALVLSEDGAAGLCWSTQGKPPVPFTRIARVGWPTRLLEAPR